MRRVQVQGGKPGSSYRGASCDQGEEARACCQAEGESAAEATAGGDSHSSLHYNLHR